MSNFSSIDDLLQQQSGQAQNPSPLHVSSEETDDIFEKKMGEIQIKERETKAARMAGSLGVPHIDLKQFPITHEALKQISREDAIHMGAICFFVHDKEIRIGALDPKSADIQTLIQKFEQQYSAHVMLYVISQSSFDRVIELYNTMPHIDPITKDIEIKSEDLEKVQAQVNNFKAVSDLVVRASTSDTVTILLGAALKVDASDVHVEAEDNGIVVRFRLDGVLHDVTTLSKDMYKRILSRIKLVSSLKINITDKPQDGRFTIKPPQGEVDVRVSTVPTVFGESIVMRLLPQNRETLTLKALGFSPRDLAILEQEIKRPNGMVITTGPTGSGKSTTLYAVLQILNQQDVKIITLEDPVEYRIEGVNQSQIDTAKGYTFAKGLRSLLRQDPDIMMVGEIRDAETANISIQAALAGHLVISTLHTNSASGAIARFSSMGAESYLLAPALNAVIGQRLVRRLCDSCRVEISLDDIEEWRRKKIQEHIALLPEENKKNIGDMPHFYRAVGCDLCSGIGYKGRIGVYEIFVVKDDIEQAVLSGDVSERSIEGLARAQGMTTMFEDAILKAVQGITSVEEIFRVTE